MGVEISDMPANTIHGVVGMMLGRQVLGCVQQLNSIAVEIVIRGLRRANPKPTRGWLSPTRQTGTV
jgi:xanthosine utilization system XapX-like protein